MNIIPDCIILVAGGSQRMGCWKPGLPWGTTTVIETVVKAALDAGCRVIVAGGNNFGLLRKILKKYPQVVVVKAWRWRKGMNETLKRGLKELSTDRFFVTPGDMPHIQSEDYTRLAGHFGASVIRPFFDNCPGHPVLLSKTLAEAIQGSKPGIPIQTILPHGDQEHIPWRHDGVIVDIDTPEAYRAAKPHGTDSP